MHGNGDDSDWFRTRPLRRAKNTGSDVATRRRSDSVQADLSIVLSGTVSNARRNAAIASAPVAARP